MPDLLIRTVDGGELRGRYDNPLGMFLGNLNAQGHETLLVTYTVQGRDPRDRVTTVFKHGIVSVAEL